MRRIETYDWWPEVLLLKDDLSLRELAARFDVTPGAISAALRRTGTTRTPAPPGPRARRQTHKADSGSGDREGAARPGSKDAQILPHRHLLGKSPDAEVAALAGVSVRTIASYRARHGIQGYAGPRRKPSSSAPRQSRIDPFAELVGVVPDRRVAERAGVSLNAVRNYRVKRGIAASRSSGRSSAATAHAWQVRYEGEEGELEGVVLAADLVQAAVRAADSVDGRVLSLAWLGPILS